MNCDVGSCGVGLFEGTCNLSQPFLLSNECSAILNYKDECFKARHSEMMVLPAVRLPGVELSCPCSVIKF